jgi:uncharacterized protein (DUF1697 family)
MQQYVAFLRGINVGGHRVKMDRLRGLFEELKLAEVSTVLASGNVIFSSDEDDADALRDRIEGHLADGLGYDVATFLRTPAELGTIAAADSPEEPSASHYVILLHEAASDSLHSAFTALRSEMDDFQFSGREIHWRIQGKMSESPLFGDSRLERAAKGVPTTTRNMNTIRRLFVKTRPSEIAS